MHNLHLMKIHQFRNSPGFTFWSDLNMKHGGVLPFTSDRDIGKTKRKDGRGSGLKWRWEPGISRSTAEVDGKTHLWKTERVAPQVGRWTLLQRPSMRRYLPGVQSVGEAKAGQMLAIDVLIMSTCGRFWATSEAVRPCLSAVSGSGENCNC